MNKRLPQLVMIPWDTAVERVKAALPSNCELRHDRRRWEIWHYVNGRWLPMSCYPSNLRQLAKYLVVLATHERLAAH